MIRLYCSDRISTPTMAKMIDLSPVSSNTRAVDAIHGFLPLVAGLFYLISSVALALRGERQEPLRQRPSRSVVAWPISIILVTYVSRRFSGPWIARYETELLLALLDTRKHCAILLVFSRYNGFR